jgi:hypothetical protein
MKITEYFNHGEKVQYRLGRYDPSMDTPRFGPVKTAEIFIDIYNSDALVAVPDLEFRASETTESENKFEVNVEDYYLEIFKKK